MSFDGLFAYFLCCSRDGGAHFTRLGGGCSGAACMLFIDTLLSIPKWDFIPDKPIAAQCEGCSLLCWQLRGSVRGRGRRKHLLKPQAGPEAWATGGYCFMHLFHLLLIICLFPSSCGSDPVHSSIQWVRKVQFYFAISSEDESSIFPLPSGLPCNVILR